MGCTIHVTLHETTWDVNTMFTIYMPIVILLINYFRLEMSSFFLQNITWCLEAGKIYASREPS